MLKKSDNLEKADHLDKGDNVENKVDDIDKIYIVESRVDNVYKLDNGEKKKNFLKNFLLMKLNKLFDNAFFFNGNVTIPIFQT